MFDMEELKTKKLLTKPEAAFYLGICVKSLTNLMKHERDFPIVRIGYNRGRVFIHREKLDTWIDGKAES